MEVHCACMLCGVHGMAHVPALGARSRVLRGERSWSSFARLWVCWADEDVGSFEGGVCHTRPNLVGPVVAHERRCACLVPHC